MKPKTSWPGARLIGWGSVLVFAVLGVAPAQAQYGNHIIWIHGRSEASAHCLPNDRYLPAGENPADHNGSWDGALPGSESAVYWRGDSKRYDLAHQVAFGNYYVGYHGSSDPREWGGYENCAAGAQGAINTAIWERCGGWGENVCVIRCHSAGCYAIDNYRATFTTNSGGPSMADFGLNVAFTVHAGSASGGSELANAQWGGSPMTNSLEVAVARFAFNHNVTEGIADYMIAGRDGGAGSGILPGEDDGAVSLGSACGSRDRERRWTATCGYCWVNLAFNQCPPSGNRLLFDNKYNFFSATFMTPSPASVWKDHGATENTQTGALNRLLGVGTPEHEALYDPFQFDE